MTATLTPMCLVTHTLFWDDIHFQSSGLAGDARINYGGHLGNERRESKAPPGSRSAVGRRERTAPGQHNSRSSERGRGRLRVTLEYWDESERLGMLVTVECWEE